MEKVVPKCKGIFTDQDAFNKVWNHFITNRHGPGYIKGVGCFTYNTHRPHARCALGIMATPKECEENLRCTFNLVPNIHRTKNNRTLWTTTFIERVLEARNITIHRRLQECHDDAASRPEWEQNGSSFIKCMRDKMTLLAEEYNLTIPE